MISENSRHTHSGHTSADHNRMLFFDILSFSEQEFELIS